MPSVAALTASVWRFGWAHTPFILACGRAVLTHGPLKDLGVVRVGEQVETTFGLYNVSSQPVRVLGVQPSCTCLSVCDVPLMIPALGCAAVRARLSVNKAGVRVRLYHVARLLLDYDWQSVSLYVTARIGVSQSDKGAQQDAHKTKEWLPLGI